MSEVSPYVPATRVAYFTMEIGIRPEIHTYAGGLGILAGDAARSSADLEFPMVFVTLASREGYLRQEIGPDGRQIAAPDPWQPEAYARPVGVMVAVEIERRPVWIRAWLYELRSVRGYAVPILLLDTDVSDNDPQDRSITNRLYAGGERNRLKQEIVLGIGGERLLRALGFRILTYHLNEGHAALLALSLLQHQTQASRKDGSSLTSPDVDRVRAMCVFTTHTPVKSGHDRFSYEDVAAILGDFAERGLLHRLAGTDSLDMSRLALNLSGYVNGVARRHAETAQQMFPGFEVRAVSNGAHIATWMHPVIAELFRRVIPNWEYEPEGLVKALQFSASELWSAHQHAKRELVAEVERRTGIVMSPETPLLGFARRMTGYKRPDLLFSDLERVRSIQAHQPFQVVIAGKAHPQDLEGQAHIAAIHAHMRQLPEMNIAFLPNYDMSVAALLVAGTDVWLNNPLPPLEASGTSGMKAALNGVLNFSVLDGWWLEGWDEGVTGWAIGLDEAYSGHIPHAGDLYQKLEEVVLPLFYRNRPRWIWMMQQAIARIGSEFNSHKMMRRYAGEAYVLY
jgi:glycogen phosphorylase